jgi:hypothetical protein
MRNSLLLVVLVLLGCSLKAQEKAPQCGPYAFRSFNIADSVGLAGSGVDTFALSQAYPATMPAKPGSGFPWEKTDFRAGAGGFMKQVLDYCWEGMDSAKWVAQNNPVRKWYHAPWLDSGYAGREFVHGLRMDRTAFPGDLHPKQQDKERNYSITFYNDMAGYTIGQVWCDPNKPDASKAHFPIGSVWFKLVFTTADTSAAPYLLNPMEWEAYVETGADLPINPKKLQKLRLLEVDFGVRMTSKDAVNGWLFGVYVFSGQKRGNSIKEKLVPIGLQWGNDPGLTPAAVREGKAIEQSWINTNVWDENNPNSSLIQKLGWGYRLQSPIGEHSGSIMSEHMTAGWPPAPRFPVTGMAIDSMLKWHRNLPSGTAFNNGQVSLDYGLELMEGMRNHAIANGDSVLGATYKAELADMLGFEPQEQGADTGDEITVVVEEGLHDSRNMYVFIGFLVLTLTLVGLLIWNFLKK